MKGTEILAGLERIANEGFVYAVLWHLVVASILVAVWLGWRPSQRLAGVLLCLPLISVSAFAWVFRNPFNGSSFALLAGVLAWLACRKPGGEMRQSPRWTSALGGLLVAFAWLYPHFLVGRPTLAYLYGAPIGLLPCPTLSLVIGAALLGYGPGTKGWSFVLASAGVFYALFGALRLGVIIDLALLTGSIGISAQALATRPLGASMRRSRIAPGRPIERAHGGTLQVCSRPVRLCRPVGTHCASWRGYPSPSVSRTQSVAIGLDGT